MGLRANNLQAIEEAFTEFREKTIPKTLEKRLKSWCDYLLMIAIMARLHAEGAHNITGNLLNSICVGLYKERKLISEHYAFNHSWIRHTIRRKMTRRDAPYYFKEDYDGLMDYLLDPNGESGAFIRETDEGHGQSDAREFLWTYKPKFGVGYTIVVAYTVEYALTAAIDIEMVAHAIHDTASTIAGLKLTGFNAEFKKIITKSK